jgi:hypothetical protein
MKCAAAGCTSDNLATVYVVQQFKHNGIIEHKDVAFCSTCAYAKIMKDRAQCPSKQ